MATMNLSWQLSQKIFISKIMELRHFQVEIVKSCEKQLKWKDDGIYRI